MVDPSTFGRKEPIGGLSHMSMRTDGDPVADLLVATVITPAHLQDIPLNPNGLSKGDA